MEEKIRETFTESIQTNIASAEALITEIESSTFAISQALISGHKILACGTHSTQHLAEHFASTLLNHFETERPSLPAIALKKHLPAMPNYGEDVDTGLANQVKALGNRGDILLVISGDGQEKELIKAVETALTNDMLIIALSAGDGGELAGLLGPEDVEVRVPAKRYARILESQLLILHCISELIDETLFPGQEVV
ncbi:SIS domain-containing protein [Algicola sagamiensis]|uniref:SIS domain-containing protein n=1 Tax=Algicola sagamiensis TaxID=163869 RepID=UPI00036E6E7B|nr:SIS domain-containing protein [Algicola sagamiensis]